MRLNRKAIRICKLPNINPGRSISGIKALVRAGVGRNGDPAEVLRFFHIVGNRVSGHGDDNGILRTRGKQNRFRKGNGINSGECLCVFKRLCIGRCSADRIGWIFQICVDLNLVGCIIVFGSGYDLTEFFIASISGFCGKNIGNRVTGREIKAVTPSFFFFVIVVPPNKSNCMINHTVKRIAGGGGVRAVVFSGIIHIDHGGNRTVL